MKKISALFVLFKSCLKFFISNRHLLPTERIRICYSNHRFSLEGKSTDTKTICQMIGDLSSSNIRQNPSNDNSFLIAQSNRRIYEDEFILHIEEISRKHGIENNITIEKVDSIYIPEASSYYHTNYKITIKKLVIYADDTRESQSMFFDVLDSKSGEVGIHLIFEGNYFVTKNDDIAAARFCPANVAYLIFKDNKFESVNMYLQTYNSYKIELTDNIFINSNVNIISSSGSINPYDVQPNIVCLESNIFHKNDGDSSKLKFNGDKDIKCYFKGKNTVDHLIISTDGYLNWGGYQNIDPQNNHAHTHKKMFMELMEKTDRKNDKMQEARFRRELLKCERALIRKEKTARSLQDGFILWWSGWISDYGVSWFRPVRLLIYINAFFATLVFYFFECQSSWGLLFAEFFNPLSSLADVMETENNSLISSINIVQKALLAIFIYEMIKIFRRFSK